MKECSAPVKGHITGSKEQKRCAVHGGVQARSTAGVSVLPSPSATTSTVPLENRKGEIVEVEAGNIRDPNAIDVYQNGQCLALAIVLAERIGSNRVLVLESRPTAEQIDEMGLDSDRFAEGDNVIHHVWALSKNGNVAHDISGSKRVNELFVTKMMKERLEGLDCSLLPMGIEEANDHCQWHMAEQDFDTADEFVDSIERERPETLDDTPLVPGDVVLEDDGSERWSLR